MLTGPSSSTRASHQRAISSAWRLVSEAANRQPVLPVQATRPARIELALVVRPELLDRGFGELQLAGRDAGDQQVLPDREPDIPVAHLLRYGGDAAHLRRRELADRQHDADPVQAFLLLGMHADMSGAIEHRPRRDGLGGNAGELPAELLLDQREVFVEAHGVEHVFHPRLVAVGAVAVVGEDAHDGVGDLGCVRGLHDDAGVAGKILVAGDAAERETEPDAGRCAESIPHFDGLEADVVGVLQHGDRCPRRRRQH